MRISTEDLRVAWRRVKRDHRSRRTFVTHPFEIALIDQDLESWISELESKIENESYRPGPCEYINIPKPQGSVRPGAILSLEDHVIFEANLQSAREALASAFTINGRQPDYAYRLRDKRDHAEWFQPHFDLWQSFDADSVARIDTGSKSHVVVADIAGYYENINLSQLGSDLRSQKVDEKCIASIMTSLRRWASVVDRGVPQGISAADLLGKLYLCRVDETLVGHGFDFVRWVDDYRIFCSTEREARQALILLIETLRARGLTIQTAKTCIIDAERARFQFNEVHELIERFVSVSSRR